MRLIKFTVVLLLLTTLYSCLSSGTLITPAHADSVITADFGVGTGLPLLKNKFNLYNTAIPSTADFERDNHLLYELPSASMRIEHNWGFGQTLSGEVGGSATDLQYDWSQSDHWQRLVNTAGMSFHWGYDYSPYPLTPRSAQPPPPNLWAQVVKTAAAHHRMLALPIVYHEVWNEPDNPPTFFSGTQEQYFELYRSASRAIQAADPDAKVGGPATAFPGWSDAFVDFVKKNRLPLDFFSIHRYGAPGLNHVQSATRALSRYPQFNRTEIVMSEYHTDKRWPRGGRQDTYAGATELLHDFMVFLEHPELTSLNWAQFQDPCDCGQEFLGLVTLDGHRKASFNAFKIYGMMPAERKQTVVLGDAVEAVASADSHKASLLLLNRTGSDQRISITLKNVAFERGTIRLYPIDKTHNSFLDGANEVLSPSQEFPDVATAGWAWAGVMPANSTLYIEADDGSGTTDALPNATANAIGVHRYYPRRDTRSYADFDTRTWIARLGMSGELLADQEVSVEAEALPSTMIFHGELEGTLTPVNTHSLLGVRLDYRTRRGFTKGVLLHGPFKSGPDVFNPKRTASMPFGTRRPADQVVRVADMAHFTIKPADYAPVGWSGRVQITFILQNAGANVRLRYTVRGQARRAWAVNAGGEQAGGFVTDSGFSGGNRFGVQEPINTRTVLDPAPLAVYQSERSARTFWHTIGRLQPRRIYKVRLHFVEFFWKQPAQRLFNVAINGQTMLDRFDIFAAAGGDHRAAVREFFIHANAKGNIHIQFVPVRDNTKVSGIEVFETLS